MRLFDPPPTVSPAGLSCPPLATVTLAEPLSVPMRRLLSVAMALVVDRDGRLRRIAAAPVAQVRLTV